MLPTSAMCLLVGENLARRRPQQMNSAPTTLSNGAAHRVAVASRNALAEAAQTVVVEYSGGRSHAPSIAARWNLHLPPTSLRVGRGRESSHQYHRSYGQFPHAHAPSISEALAIPLSPYFLFSFLSLTSGRSPFSSSEITPAFSRTRLILSICISRLPSSQLTIQQTRAAASPVASLVRRGAAIGCANLAL